MTLIIHMLIHHFVCFPLLQLTKLPNGVTVASIENYAPVSRIALVANAGSRFEDGDNMGVTHCLRVASGLVSFSIVLNQNCSY